MLSNIIKNAIEASPNKENIAVSLQNDGAINIKIHNMGVVPADIRDSFFDKYSTIGKRHGTGLGTYSARLAAKAQGGSIGLETSEALGTEVILSFPKQENKKSV
jgi:signal transduction histidine kinase